MSSNINFVLVTINHSVITQTGLPQVYTFRKIEILETYLSDYVSNLEAQLGFNLDLSIQDSHTLYAKPTIQDGGVHVSYHFTVFPEDELPHYAKQMTKEELGVFLDHAKDQGLHFTRG